MTAKLDSNEAFKIAQEYIDQKFISWTIENHAKLVDKFLDVKGYVWVIEAKSVAREIDTFFIISDESGEIELLLHGDDMLTKLKNIKPNLTIKTALAKALEYKNENKIFGKILNPIVLYESVLDIENYTWVVNIKLPPSPFEQSGTAIFINDNDISNVFIKHF